MQGMSLVILVNATLWVVVFKIPPQAGVVAIVMSLGISLINYTHVMFALDGKAEITRGRKWFHRLVDGVALLAPPVLCIWGRLL